MDLAQKPPYTTIDFKALTKTNPDFKTIWQQCSGKLNFQDPATLQALSRAILKTDFNLDLDVPDDRLCPPIPNRWSYISWIHSLLDSTSPNYSRGYDPERKVTGLDIGTGASAIYAMLSLRSRPNWHMCATDIDKKSFDAAARNLALNSLLTRSTLLQTRPSDPLIPLKALGVDQLDFTICNPPFFASQDEMTASLAGTTKNAKPHAVCTGSVNEMVAEGGDVGFVMRLVDESMVLRDKVGWYTSLCGKLSTAKTIIAALKERGVDNWAVGTIDPGSGGGTKRWVVAWSFGDFRPSNAIARHAAIGHEFLPFPTTYSITLPAPMSPSTASDTITTYLSSLDLSFSWDNSTSTGTLEAAQNVWSRAYRRAYEKRKREATGVEGNDNDEDMERKVALAVRVQVIGPAREVDLNWLRGRDQVLWESFCGVVHSKLK